MFIQRGPESPDYCICENFELVKLLRNFKFLSEFPPTGKNPTMETKSIPVVEYPGYLFAPFADMKYEQNRLNSFTRGHWGESRGNPRELAKAGFYFRENKLHCYVCSLELSDTWNPEDVPIDFHKDRNPHCNFVKGTADNVPIRTSGNLRIPESARNAHVGVDQVIAGGT